MSERTAAGRAAMLGRLRAVAPHILAAAEDVDALAARGPAPLLGALARRVQTADRADLLWLLLAGFLGVLPQPDQVRWARRRLRVAAPHEAADVVLRVGLDDPRGWADPDVELDVVVGGVVVDVDFCAKFRHNTGIQRVVRQTVSRWTRDQDVVLVAWTASGSGLRTLGPDEHDRVTAWDGRGAETRQPPRDPAGHRLVVPVGSVVVIPEVPQAAHCDPLAALAEFSSNRVAMVGYDTIPVTSPDTVDAAETERFVRYLTVVKHADRVAGISQTVADEFAGFASAVTMQGLTGPHTLAVRLPVDTPTTARAHGQRRARPLVLCVGSQEPRKNHGAVLHAAGVLRGEGLEFTLRFIGAGSFGNVRRFDRQVARVRAGGGEVEVLRGVDDATLVQSYADARFTVFPSIHEGYGLPVAESLALGTPVITTGYGSTAEIAAGGGCLVVDPRDDEALIAAMRRLLTDDVELARLRTEARDRVDPTWDDYATDLWRRLVVPLRADRHGAGDG